MMEVERVKELVEEYNSKASIGGVVSINDLQDKDFDGKHLSLEEKKALVNFEKYRIYTLNQQESEEAFHKKYMELQVMANLSPFDEFLKDKYVVEEKP